MAFSNKWVTRLQLGHPQYIVWLMRSNRVFFAPSEEKKGRAHCQRQVAFFSLSGTISPCLRTLSTKQYTDSALGKRVLMYWEIWGKIGVILTTARWMENYGKLCIFGNGRISTFQKCKVFHEYYEYIHVAVTRISPIFKVC